MDSKFQRIALGQIDCDNGFYRISSRQGTLADLVASISKLGVINPPVLFAAGQLFTIVTGFGRIKAALQAGRQEIPCLVLPEDESPERCARIAVTENALHRPLDLLEQARAIAILTGALNDVSQLPRAARECGLAVNRDMVLKLSKVSQMPEMLQQGIANGHIALPVALQLDEMKDEAQSKALAGLLTELNVGLNVQRELIEWITAIVRRDNLSIVSLLQSGKLGRIRIDADMDRRKKAQEIRQLIKKMRYPAISRYEAHYAQTLESLNLAKGSYLDAPAHFESATYRLRFDVQNPDDLLKIRKELDKLIQSPSIGDLWKNDPS